jgi:glutaredoxin
MRKYFISIIIISFLFQGISYAEYYKWEDEQGMLHVTDYPPPEKTVKNIKVHDYDDELTNSAGTGKQNNQQPSKPVSSARANKNNASREVVLYVTSWCPYSQKAREYFKSHNIPFTEYDIEKDKDAAKRLEEIAPRSGVPVAVINGDIIGGFSPRDYERALLNNP